MTKPITILDRLIGMEEKINLMASLVVAQSKNKGTASVDEAVVLSALDNLVNPETIK